MVLKGDYDMVSTFKWSCSIAITFNLLFCSSSVIFFPNHSITYQQHVNGIIGLTFWVVVTS